MARSVLTKKAKNIIADQATGRVYDPNSRAMRFDSYTGVRTLQNTLGNRTTSHLLDVGNFDTTLAVNNVPSIVYQVLRSPGQPLEPSIRAFMESKFGYDLGNVRVHTDKRATTSAEELSANAFTVNNHVVFGAHKFTPQSQTGKQLLAHELAHVVQTREASSTVSRIVPRDSEWEKDADKASLSIQHGKPYSVKTRAPAAVYRQAQENIPVVGPLPEQKQRLLNRLRFAKRIGDLVRRNYVQLIKNLGNASFAFLGGIIGGMQAKISRNEWSYFQNRMLKAQEPFSGFQTGFLVGAIEQFWRDLYKTVIGIESLIKIVSELTEEKLLARVEKAIEFLGSSKADREILRAGRQIGIKHAEQLKSLARKSFLTMGYGMGRIFGPFVIEIVFSFVTFGAGAVATSTARAGRAAAKISRLLKRERMRRAQRGLHRKGEPVKRAKTEEPFKLETPLETQERQIRELYPERFSIKSPKKLSGRPSTRRPTRFDTGRFKPGQRERAGKAYKGERFTPGDLVRDVPGRFGDRFVQLGLGSDLPTPFVFVRVLFPPIVRDAPTVLVFSRRHGLDSLSLADVRRV